MKGLVNAMISGVRTGALFYLLTFLAGQLWSGLVYPPMTARNVVAILIMSGVIGGYTYFLDSFEDIGYSLLIVLHFCLTILVVIITCLIMGWGGSLLNPMLWFLFCLIYVAVWLYQLFWQRQKTKKINQALKNRKDK